MPQVIISPAKQMRVAADAFAPRGIPPFPKKTRELHRALTEIGRREGPEGLKALWKVSDRLLAENLERLGAFVPVMDESELDNPATAALVSPALFSYVGIQYRSLAPEVLDLDALTWLQDHLWVLSGLYGCVRPFDAVEPYRLEMGAALAVAGEQDLYGFWGDDIACAVSEAGEAVVNLASVEYARAVLPRLPESVPVVTCIFGEELRRGRPVQRSTASKIARGSMVRWMAERGVGDPAELEAFNVGYRLAPGFCSEDEPRRGGRTLVFMRDGA